MWKELAPLRQLTRAATLSARQRPITLSSTPASATFPARRTFLSSPRRAAEPQDEEDHYHDRHKLDPSRTESSQSATTDEVATQAQAYDPTRTAPEDEIGASKEETASKGEKRDPLTVSAADHDLSKSRDPLEGGAEKNVDKPERSARGAPIKNRQRK